MHCMHHSDGLISHAGYTRSSCCISPNLDVAQVIWMFGGLPTLNLSITLPAGLPASSQRGMYLGVYVGLGLGYSLLVFMRSWSNALGGFHAR